MGSNPSAFTENPQRPVEHVSWNDCQTFINTLNQLTGKTFRLPTGPDSGIVRVYRGGAWNTVGRACRVSLRADIIPSSEINHIGLRLAL
jgi:formylglycine-generating enzyme required for sulfatase activity